MRERYAGLDTNAGQSEPLTPEGLAPPDGQFLGLYIEEELAACGDIRLLESDIGEIADHVARRLRGLAYGRKMLSSLEDAARGLGCERVRLDTGERQLEAQQLYQDAGYKPISAYNDMPQRSRCPACDLAPATEVAARSPASTVPPATEMNLALTGLPPVRPLPDSMQGKQLPIS